MGIETEIYQNHIHKNIPEILSKLVNFENFTVQLYSEKLISSDALEKSQNDCFDEYNRKFEIFSYLMKTLTYHNYEKIIKHLVDSKNGLCADILKKVVKNDNQNESEWVRKFGGMVIGIDLGTTYSCVGGYIEKEDKVVIYPDECGRRLTPSIVSFTESGKILVGYEAKKQMEINPGNTIYNVKRIIGRSWDDPIVQDFRSTVPYQIINEDGKPKIKVKTEKKSVYSPEEISAIILTKMREIAELNLKEKVDFALITAPAYFNDAQRNATKYAGELTGLTILKIINEPTAAALAYNLEPTQKISERAILVYDLGGGTFDVSVLEISSDEDDKDSEEFGFSVEVTNGLTYLGGEDFNNRITEYLIKICQDKYQKDIKKSRSSMKKLQIEVEKAKRDLSESNSTEIEINFENEIFTEVLSRETFEELNEDLFKSSMRILKMVVHDAKTKKGVDKFSEIVLVGGSTRIPKIQKLVRDFFGKNGTEIITGFCPDEAVAYGAALYARILTVGHKKVAFLSETTPLSLGVEAIGGLFSCIVAKNTSIPIECSKMFYTFYDYQTEVEVNVYEGEEKKANENNLLGTFYLTGITPAKGGIPQINVKFIVESDGFLQVSANEIQTGNENLIKIMTSRNSGNPSSENSGISKFCKISKEEMDRRNELSQLIFQKRFQMARNLQELQVEKLTEFENIIEESEAILNLAQDGDEISRMAEYWQQILKLENIFIENINVNLLGDGKLNLKK